MSVYNFSLIFRMEEDLEKQISFLSGRNKAICQRYSKDENFKFPLPYVISLHAWNCKASLGHEE